MKLTINVEEKKAPVFAQYENQCNPQPAYLVLDPVEPDLEADYSGEIGNGMPADVWHNRVIRISIPACSSYQGIKALEENEQLIKFVEKMRDSFEDHWDGNNYVGRYYDGWADDLMDIERMIEGVMDYVDVWDAQQWIVESFCYDEYIKDPKKYVDELEKEAELTPEICILGSIKDACEELAEEEQAEREDQAAWEQEASK